MCRVLRVSRSSFYEWLRGRTWRPDKDAGTLAHIKAAHQASRGTYGSPRVVAELRAQGMKIGRRRVARLMSESGLSGTPKRRFKGTTTDSAHGLKVAPNLLDRQFTVASPNAVWVGDITYLPVADGWVYLAVLIDLYSRKVVGWSMADNMETELCLAALRQAVTTRRGAQGTMHHSDRGSQYASRAYTTALSDFGMVQSMSRKGNCWDNAVAESFFGTLEQELIKGRVWTDLAAAQDAVGDYIHRFYNQERRHSNNGHLSPVEFEAINQTAGRQVA